MPTTVAETIRHKRPATRVSRAGASGVRHFARRFTIAILVAMLLSTGAALCQPPTKQSPAAPAKKAVPAIVAVDELKSSQPPLTAMTLEEMLAAALKDNPDIRVAEAKLREAEAELNRARLDVAQKVALFYHGWEGQKAKVAEFEEAAKHTEELTRTGTIPKAAGRQSRIDSQTSRATLAKLEAELPYLLGKAPPGGSAARSPLRTTKTYAPQHVPTDDTVRGILEVLTRIDSEVAVEPFAPNNSLVISGTPSAHALASAVIKAIDRSDPRASRKPKSRSEMEEKILKALNTTIKAKYDEVPLDEILKGFRESFGIPFVSDSSQLSRGDRGAAFSSPKVTLDLGDVPLAIALQAIQDTQRVAFTVRDYGIHVSTQSFRGFGGGLGEGSVVDYWKREMQTKEPE